MPSTIYRHSTEAFHSVLSEKGGTSGIHSRKDGNEQKGNQTTATRYTRSESDGDVLNRQDTTGDGYDNLGTK